MHYDLPRGNKIDYRVIHAGDSINGWTFLDAPTAQKCRVNLMCDCGRVKSRESHNVLGGNTRSCKSCAIGNMRRTHGGSSAGRDELTRKLFIVWQGVKWRCSESNFTEGGMKYAQRGVTVCEAWRADFPAFFAWAVASGYAPGLSIDRIDNDGHYEPGNCRWATSAQQARNKRNSRLLTAFGETKTAADWADDPRCPVRASAVYRRISCGWLPEEAVTRLARRNVGGRYVTPESFRV